MPAALDRIYRMNRIFPWADGHLNPNKSFVGDLLLGITPQALLMLSSSDDPIL